MKTAKSCRKLHQIGKSVSHCTTHNTKISQMGTYRIDSGASSASANNKSNIVGIISFVYILTSVQAVRPRPFVPECEFEYLLSLVFRTVFVNG